MRYTVIDIETTGFYPESAEITEIAGANVIDGDVISTFSSLVKANMRVTKYIEDLTGISNKMLKYAETFTHVFEKFIMSLNINSDTNLVIHNAEFDYNFIKFWIEKDNKINEELKASFINANVICSLDLARKLMPGESHKLEYMKNKFNIKTKSHRALNDVLVTKKIYEKLLELENDIKDWKEK